MKIVRHFIVNIVLSASILFWIANFVPEFGLKISSEYKNISVVFGILGIIFWITNSLLKKILQALTLPVKYLTLGLSSLIINLLMFYVFEQFVNYLDIGINVKLGDILQTAILSIIMTALYFVVKKII